jgi:hypothetical protein
VKNQYFGDKRDLLKYSLLEALTDGITTVNQLTCIWLLTPPSTKNDGNRHFRESRSTLATFLHECVVSGRRDVRELAKYMAIRPKTYFSFGDEPKQYFSPSTRTTYFASIPDSALHNAVVFFDPDNGFEPGITVSAAHLKYSELGDIFSRMDEVSVAVVYQHLPRKPAETFWPAIAGKVHAALECSVGFLAAGDVGFMIAARDQQVTQQVNRTIDRFEVAWPRRLRISHCARPST